MRWSYKQLWHGKIERLRDKLKGSIKAAEEKKTNIEEQNFNEKIDIAEFTKWSKVIDQNIGEVDEVVARLNECLKEANMIELAQEQKIKLAYIRKKLEQEVALRKQALEVTSQDRQHRNVKLPKLKITEFNELYNTWLSFGENSSWKLISRT